MEYEITEDQTSLFIIESLRAGIPTRLATRELPDMRQDIRDIILNDLQSFQGDCIPQGRLIWGQYGQGKTHVLTMAEHVALDMGFAVSRISLSREVSCHNLSKFYGRVAQRLKTPDSDTLGLQFQLNHISPSELSGSRILEKDRYVHPLPAVVLEGYMHTSGEEQDRLYTDLLGVRLPIPELKRIHRLWSSSALPKMESFKVNQHSSAYFGVMADAVKLCGYRGWVILIDELELIGRLGKTSRLNAYLNLSWLMNWAGNMKYPIYTLAAAATRLQDDIWYGRHDDDRTIMPVLAENKYDAEAGKCIMNFFDKAIGNESIQVEPPQIHDIVKLLDILVKLHGQAYGWVPSMNCRDLIDRLGSQTVRTYIRATLETLDMKYQYDEEVELKADDLNELDLVEDVEFFIEESEIFQ